MMNDSNENLGAPESSNPANNGYESFFGQTDPTSSFPQAEPKPEIPSTPQGSTPYHAAPPYPAPPAATPTGQQNPAPRYYAPSADPTQLAQPAQIPLHHHNHMPPAPQHAPTYPAYDNQQQGGGSAFYNPAYPPKAPKKKGKGGLVVGLVSLSLVSALAGGGIAGGVVAASSNYTGGSSVATSNDGPVTVANETVTSELSKVISEKLPSIVTVSVMSDDNGGTGSGVVLNKDGYIVTNAHVATLAGATDKGTINVQTSTGDSYPATLVGYDATADLAVLKVDAKAKGLAPISFASSDKVKVGNQTIAIGSPLGLASTVTTGIVSSLNRPIEVASSQVGGDPGAGIALSAIQTDAAINSGNSGGALLDANGNLIGINVAIASAGQSSGSIGVGFAIPSDYVKRVVDEIIATGSATHGYLGASVGDYNPNKATYTSGAEIQEISDGSAASKSQLKQGDVITKVNVDVIESATQFVALIKQQAPGSKVTITYERDGVEAETDVTLGSQADSV